MTTNKHTNSIEDLREQLEEFALHLKPGTTKGKHRTAIFDTLELARLVQTLIDKQMIEARQADFEKNLEIMKELWQENFMYRTLSGEYKHPDGDVKRMFVEYQELEPERAKFAEYVETRITELKKKGEK